MNDTKPNYDKIIEKIMNDLKKKMEQEEHINNSDGESEILSSILYYIEEEYGKLSFSETKEIVDYVTVKIEDWLNQNYYQICNYEDIEMDRCFIHYYTLKPVDDIKQIRA